MNTSTAPFADLSPDAILSAVDQYGCKTDGRLLALNSYENRVYQIGLEQGPPIVGKFYRPGRWTDAGILEEHALIAELAAQELPVVPPLRFNGQQTLLHSGGYRFSLFPRQGGRVPEISSKDQLQWLGRLLGRLHAIGAQSAYSARPTLSVTLFGDEPRAYLLQGPWLPPDLTNAYSSVSAHALDAVRRCFERAGDINHIRLHGDCYPGNLLWTDDGPHFVDFDDSRMGPAIQDLWMLLAGDRAAMGVQLRHLLTGYQTFYDFNTSELYLLEALRTLRLIHYSAWLAKRWDDPAFPLAFPWFNSPRYWQDRIIELREQIALMDEAPLELY